MKRIIAPLISAGLFVLAWAQAGYAEDPWADQVIDVHAIDPVPGYNTPEKTLGEPVGGTMSTPDNSSLHSLGMAGSYIVLKFDTPITDDPSNPMGLDCIVYGNAFWIGGNPNSIYMEPGIIEISEDVDGNGEADDPWYVIPGSRDLPQSTVSTGIPNPPFNENDWGYGPDMNPTQQKYLDNYVRPDNPFAVGVSPRSGGGDAFNIAWAEDGAGQPAGISQFHFIRIWTLVQGGSSTEMDAAADIAPDIDLDGDDILDEYETRVANTDPTRPESTVLALEIPAEDGGSPAGTQLGTASDSDGNSITLYSSGTRSTPRNFNCIVDILYPGDPGGTIPGLTKSDAFRDFQSSETDFSAAQIQNAELVIHYSDAEIAGLDEAGLQPYRFESGNYSQTGISNITLDTVNNTVTFRSQFSGIFVLASMAGPLAIIQQPVSQTQQEGESATFTVIVAGGVEPISYQWRRDGMDLTGGDQSTYTIAAVEKINHEGSYTCLVTDDTDDSVESDAAILTVLAGMATAGGVALAMLLGSYLLVGVVILSREKTKSRMQRIIEN